MFFNLIRQNSRQNRKENGLFFLSMIISIIACYLILSLSHQDVMVFLRRMESDAVNRLMLMIPVFYGAALFLLFFLVYFAGSYQMHRRSHEFGVYLMMGMKRKNLFFMLLAEDVWSSLCSLLIGLPVAVLLTELVSLLTVRLVGLGILGHRFTLSIGALAGTVAGFLGIKFAAFFLLSGKIAVAEIGTLLTPDPEVLKDRPKKGRDTAFFLGGVFLLAVTYASAILGMAWGSMPLMAGTLGTGIIGTFLLFKGLRLVVEAAVKRESHSLWVFTFRQLQENVIVKNRALAVCSLLMLSALCCLGFGIAASLSFSGDAKHTLDYTISCETDGEKEQKILAESGIGSNFQKIFLMKVGSIYREEGENPYQMDQVMELLDREKKSPAKDSLINNLSYATDPYLISLSGYNELLSLAGEKTITLGNKEAAVYMDSEFTNGGKLAVMNRILDQKPLVSIYGEDYTLEGAVKSVNLVVDRAITLSFAVILPDEAFERLMSGKEYHSYLDAVLSPKRLEDQSLMEAMMEMNEQLDQTELSYESYLQNRGRQLFYVVAASYITIYLAVILLVIANTMIGVQFLMQQQKTGQRCRILIHLGSSYPALCESAKIQIGWYFGLPTAVAVISSVFGIRALFSGLVSTSASAGQTMFVLTAAGAVLFICLIEWGYFLLVVRGSNRYLLTLMKPIREE